MTLITQLVTLLLATCTLASKPLEKEVCGASCYYSLLKIRYAGADKKAQAACTNPLRVESTYYCMALHCDEADVEPGINWWAGTCKKSKKVVNEKAYRSSIANVTDEYLAGLPVVELKHKGVVSGPAVPSAASWHLVYQSVYTYDYMRHFANSVRFIPYGFWAILLLVGMGNRVLQLFGSKHAAKNAKNANDSENEKPQTETTTPKLKGWVQRNLLMAPTFAYHHHQPLGWFTVPLRLQSIVIISYIAIHIAVCSVHYPIYDENYYYATRVGQALRYFGDRLGAMMSSSFPLLFLFGGKGNIFIPLTGWSYRTFSLFHRWIGIVLFIEALVHGIVFSAYYVNEKGWGEYRDKLAHDDIMRYGVLITTALGITVAIASSPIRKQAYELFKAGHLVLAAIILAGLYEHIKGQFAGKYRVWVWLSVGVWCAGRAFRLLRALVMNYKMFTGSDTLAMASYSKDTGMIRLQVYPSIMPSRQTPGVHYYLHFAGWRIWEHHPFSLAGRSTDEVEVASYSSNEPKTAQASTAAAGTGSEVDKPYLTFMIRPRDGMTRRLRDSLSHSGSPRRMRILLDGPYGSAADLGRFDEVIFIAGGSGVTAVLPYIRTLFEDTTNSNVPNVRLAWAVRHEGFARDVFSNDLRHTHSSALAATKLRTEVYVTAETRATESESDTGDSVNAEQDPVFKYSRPEVGVLVGEFIGAARGRVAVFVCGPAKMADDARAAVRKCVKKNGEVELFEEMYGW